jgi:hypothetical protein
MEIFNKSTFIEIPKKTPYSPLQKKPYIKLKLEAKNLDKAIINVNNININDFKKAQNLTHNINLQPFAKISLNNNTQSYTTEAAKSNNPQWDKDEIQFELDDPKTDKILIVINTHKITGFNANLDNLMLNDTEGDTFVAFQLLPISYLERGGFIGSPQSLWLKLIITKPDEFFQKDNNLSPTFDKHDPEYYIRSEKQASKESRYYSQLTL